MSSGVMVVLCSCPDAATAQSLAKTAVERRVAACVNIVPNLTSVYRWQGAVEIANEHLLIIKTSPASYAALENLLEGLHPYQIPEIIALPVERGLPSYLEWVGSETADQ